MKLLREELARCRELGFAQDIGEITPGVNVVSAPLFAHHDKIIGCIILIGTFPKSMIEKFG
jgi:DNA-binding IclR family transcriptional regulator